MIEVMREWAQSPQPNMNVCEGHTILHIIEDDDLRFMTEHGLYVMKHDQD